MSKLEDSYGTTAARPMKSHQQQVDAKDVLWLRLKTHERLFLLSQAPFGCQILERLYPAMRMLAALNPKP